MAKETGKIYILFLIVSMIKKSSLSQKSEVFKWQYKYLKNRKSCLNCSQGGFNVNHIFPVSLLPLGICHFFWGGNAHTSVRCGYFLPRINKRGLRFEERQRQSTCPRRGLRYPIWFNSMFEFCQNMIHSIFNSILLYPKFNSKYKSIQ